MSVGGIMVMIILVHNAIPIFTLSFYKDALEISKDIVRIQSNFQWGGSSNRKNVHWFSWKMVCLPKEK